MTRNYLIIFAFGGSAALLAGAYFFEYIIGLAPCQMCYWQRWPHMAAVAVGVAALAIGVAPRLWAVLGASAAAATTGLGLYHAGVEQRWWPGPASCTGTGGLSGLSGQDLLSTDGPAVVLCDQISWQFAGLSMPAWNAAISAALVLLWLAAARRHA